MDGETQYGRGAKERILISFILNRMCLGIFQRIQVNISVGNWSTGLYMQIWEYLTYKKYSKL